MKSINLQKKSLSDSIKAITLLFTALLLLASLLEVAGAAAQSSQKMPVIVGFKDKNDAALIRKQGGDIKYQYSIINAIACSLPQRAIEALERNPRIAYIELDGKVQIAQEEHLWRSVPFDGVDRIDAELVHPNNKGTGVKVAILDTGIDYEHDALIDSYVSGIDYVNDDLDPMDDHGHGTHCAGIVAAKYDGFGVIGVAPEALLYGAKVLDATGSGEVSDVLAGIQWAMGLDEGAGVDIISMSFGSSKDNEPVRLMCEAAYAKGILLVASAGNEYHIRGKKEVDSIRYPAKYDSVIAVGATDNTDTRASFSSTGSALELVAPGENINSTHLGDTYVLRSGTSMACPFVSGTAALILSGNPSLSPSDVRDRLRNAADDLGNPGWDSWYGYGLVDANAEQGAPSITKLTPAVGEFINTVTPTISAIVTDIDGINPDSIKMTLYDTTVVEHLYDSSTGNVSFHVPTSAPLAQGRNTATITAADNTNGGNSDVTSWSFIVDTIVPEVITGITVEPISSSALFISWDASQDPFLDHYNLYRKAEYETEYSHLVNVGPCPEEGWTPTFPDTNLEPGTTHWYYVTAVDMAGNEGSPSAEVEGTPTTVDPGEMHIDRIMMNWGHGRGTNRKNEVVFAEAWVFIVDANGVPVPGATVSGTWTGATTNSDSSITDDMGIARLRSDTVRNPSSGTTFIIVVDNVVFGDWHYDQEANVETSDSITYP